MSNQNTVPDAPTVADLVKKIRNTSKPYPWKPEGRDKVPNSPLRLRLTPDNTSTTHQRQIDDANDALREALSKGRSTPEASAPQTTGTIYVETPDSTERADAFAAAMRDKITK